MPNKIYYYVDLSEMTNVFEESMNIFHSNFEDMIRQFQFEFPTNNENSNNINIYMSKFLYTSIKSYHKFLRDLF